MDRDRVMGFVVFPILAWVLLIGAIAFGLQHPLAAMRITYVLGIVGVLAVIIRQWQSSRLLETVLAMLVCVACADVMGVL